MVNKERPKFPDGFFSKSRPVVDLKETLKDVIPIQWSKKVVSKKKKATVFSAKQKNITNFRDKKCH